MRTSVIAVAVLGWLGCSHPKAESPPPPPPASAATAERPAPTADVIRASEEAATQRNAERRECTGRVTIYSGSINIDAHDYVQSVVHGDADVAEPIPDLDRVVSTAPSVDFTLDYPFEKPFRGSVTGQLTLRRIIDAVRGGFRHMYEGATVRDIPKMYNKDVTGPYGRAFHVIGDLVIEQIDLCNGQWLDLTIGS